MNGMTKKEQIDDCLLNASNEISIVIEGLKELKGAQYEGISRSLTSRLEKANFNIRIAKDTNLGRNATYKK